MKRTHDDEGAVLTPFLMGLSDDINAITINASLLAGSLSLPQWHWTSKSGVWSIARCLDHLNRTGYTALPAIQMAIQNLKSVRRLGSDNFSYNLTERLFVAAMGPKSRIKLPVPPMFEPAVAPNTDIIVPQFLALQNELSDCVKSARGLDLSAATVASPVNEKLRFRLGAYMEAIVRHEQYHYQQVESLRKNPQFPMGQVRSGE
jgi:hypothetical protein